MWNDKGFGQMDTSTAGGFMPSFAESPSTSASKGKAVRKMQNIVPMEIKAIHEGLSRSDSLKLGEMDVHMVTFIGLVKSADLQTTSITYTVNDLTGAIVVKEWITESEDNPMSRTIVPMKVNTYIRVVGSVRNIRGELFVQAYRVLPILDLNELTMHLLEVMHTKLTVEKKEKNRQAAAVLDQSRPVASGMSLGMGFSLNQTSSTVSVGSSDQDKVFRYISSCVDEEGCSTRQIQENVQLPPSVIKNALKFLCEEGHIYSTIDEDHYKSTSD